MPEDIVARVDVSRQFAQRGFEATTMRDIADAAGLSAGNLYRYFESKDAMVTAILSEFSDRLLDAYQEVLAVGTPAVESLEAICWLLDQAGREFSREIDMLKGNGRVLSLDVASHYRYVAPPALVASCVREIMWAPMRDFIRGAILAGAARRY